MKKKIIALFLCLMAFWSLEALPFFKDGFRDELIYEFSLENAYRTYFLIYEEPDKDLYISVRDDNAKPVELIVEVDSIAEAYFIIDDMKEKVDPDCKSPVKSLIDSYGRYVEWDDDGYYELDDDYFEDKYDWDF